MDIIALKINSLIIPSLDGSCIGKILYTDSSCTRWYIDPSIDGSPILIFKGLDSDGSGKALRTPNPYLALNESFIDKVFKSRSITICSY